MTTNEPSRGRWSNSLRARILRMFAVTTTLVVLLTLWLTRDATYRHSTAQLASHHEAASRVVYDRLQMQSRLLRDGLRDLSSNFSVKQLVAAGRDDPESLTAAMDNYRQRLSADAYAVVSDDGEVIVASGMNTAGLSSPEAFSAEGLSWHDTDASPLLLKAAPLRFAERSPKVNAWLLMGRQSQLLIDDSLIALTGAQISLVTLQPEAAIWGSTLPLPEVQQLLPLLRSLQPGINDIALGGEAQVAGMYALTPDAALWSVATIAENEAYLNYEALLSRLVLALLVAVALATVAAMRVSGGITRPIQSLVAATHTIREGREARDLPQGNTNEVDALSFAIVDMQEGIRTREREINRLAFFDELTGLPNRNRFVSYLEEKLATLESGAVLTVALMDVDRFQEVNDTVGHDAGDRLLSLIAERLQRGGRSGDFIARLGGDEFAIVSTRPMKSAERLGEEVIKVFEQPFSIDGLMLDAHASIGLSQGHCGSADGQALLQQADIALYSSKSSHEPYRIYDESLNQYSVKRLKLMTELKEAIADDQLILYYQPKMRLDENVVDSVECLIRWQHPEYGMVPPDEFIGLAEQTGTIRELTQWALNTALTQQAQWAGAGHALTMAVNISAVDLIDMNLPALVGELQSRFELVSGDLVLEVTESAVMQDPESAIMALRTLCRMGVKLSIDDFGTGFSSMAQLKKMPVDELKIDKAFVQSLATNRDDQVMVRTLIALAENLGLDTVAEGVEDAESLQLLRDMGCKRIQGYFLSRPMPANELEAWLGERA